MSVNPVAFSEDQIRAVAHTLWLEEGMPHGRAEAHWFKALEIVNAEAVNAVAAVSSEAPAAKPKRKAPAGAAAKKAAPRKRG